MLKDKVSPHDYQLLMKLVNHSKEIANIITIATGHMWAAFKLRMIVSWKFGTATFGVSKILVLSNKKRISSCQTTCLAPKNGSSLFSV